MEAQLFCRTCGRGHRVILIAMSSPACTAEISVQCKGRCEPDQTSTNTSKHLAAADLVDQLLAEERS